MLLKKFIVPVDYSANAQKAVRFALKLAEKNNAEVKLLHVEEFIHNQVGQPFRLYNKYTQLLKEDSLEILREFEQSVAKDYPHLKISSELISGDIVDSIVIYAQNHRYQLIIIGTQGASGLKTLLWGSVASKVVNHSTIPVLAIPNEYHQGPVDCMVLLIKQFDVEQHWLNPAIELAKIMAAKFKLAVFVDSDAADIGEYLEIKNNLNGMVSRVKSLHPEIVVEGIVLRGKEFHEAVENFCEKQEADILVFIKHHQSLIERIIHPSVSVKLMFTSTRPILALPSKN